MSGPKSRDLFVLVPDIDIENTIVTLLSERQRALGVSIAFDKKYDLRVHPHRDSGCYTQGVDMIRPCQKSHRRALIIFDRDGCQAPRNDSAQKVEDHVQQSLTVSGWAAEDVAVVVVEPEIEAWVWSDSPHVSKAIGWTGHESIRKFLEGTGHWPPGATKPTDPKGALNTIRRKVKAPISWTLFVELARKVSVEGCTDRAFCKLRDTLRQWFGSTGD